MRELHDLSADDRPLRALLVAVALPGVGEEELERSLAELGRLAKTLGLEVMGRVTQARPRLEPGTVIGPGKCDEIKTRVEEGEVDALVVDHDITPSQLRNLEVATGAEVMDRTGVIIEIFHRHAKSPAARAQVEIVRLLYLAPRLRELKTKGKGGRQQGGIGGKGAGESRHELDRRKIRDRIAELGEEIEALEKERLTRRERRRDLQRVALVGYTNAGKSTLMRALTGSEVLVADKLFATLDTTVRVLQPETRPRILVSDTVGFIEKLPHGLVASFKSTLDEALEATLLLHVVDVSDPAWPRQCDVTLEVLREIGAGDIPRVLVLNKIDRVGDDEARASVAAAMAAEHSRAVDARDDRSTKPAPGCEVISAKRPDDVARLRARLIAFFAGALEETELTVPWNLQALRGRIFEEAEVLSEGHDDDGAIFRIRAPASVIASLRAALAVD
jgi:GTPase